MGVVLQGSACKLRQETSLAELRREVLQAAQFNTVKFTTSERLLRKQSIDLEIRKRYRRPDEIFQEGVFDYGLAGALVRLGESFAEERCLLPAKFTTHNVVV